MELILFMMKLLLCGCVVPRYGLGCPFGWDDPAHVQPTKNDHNKLRSLLYSFVMHYFQNKMASHGTKINVTSFIEITTLI